MLSCKGCTHLVANGRACAGDDGDLIRTTDPLTGRVRYVNEAHPERGGWRPSPEEMRVQGGQCGTDRKLYKPTFFARLFPSMFV